MREFVILGILMLNIVLQSSVFPFIQVSNAKPDSLLALVVSFSLIAGNPTGAVVGFAGGLLQDILFGNNIGLYSLQYMLIGYIAGFAHSKVYIDRLLVPVAFIAVFNIFKQLIMLIYSYFMKIDILLNQIFIRIVVVETLYTIILMPLIYFIIYRLYQHKFMKRKLWREKI